MKTLRQSVRKKNFVQGKVRHKICLKTDKTTENVARYVRRMDTYPVESKSGNLDGYYYDFGLR